MGERACVDKQDRDNLRTYTYAWPAENLDADQFEPELHDTDIRIYIFTYHIF